MMEGLSFLDEHQGHSIVLVSRSVFDRRY